LWIAAFVPYQGVLVSLAANDIISMYAIKTGYTNSTSTSFSNTKTISTGGLGGGGNSESSKPKIIP